MDPEVAKAINNVSKKVNDLAERLDKYLNQRINNTNSSLQDTDMAVFELAQLISNEEEEQTNG